MNVGKRAASYVCPACGPSRTASSRQPFAGTRQGRSQCYPPISTTRSSIAGRSSPGQGELSAGLAVHRRTPASWASHTAMHALSRRSGIWTGHSCPASAPSQRCTPPPPSAQCTSIMTSSEPMPSPWQRRASRSPCTPIFPTASVHGWPSWVTGTPPDPYLDVEVSWSSSLGVFRHLCTGRGAVVVRLSDDDATEKLAAMRAYRT